MKNETKLTASNVIIFLISMTIILVICKIVKVITCSWWIVTLPFWICFAFVIAILIFILRLK